MSKKLYDFFWDQPFLNVLFDIFIIEDHDYNVLHIENKLKAMKFHLTFSKYIEVFPVPKDWRNYCLSLQSPYSSKYNILKAV
ncbi:MAG: hypothetical protein HN368_16555 [Spirochaetales bacterium]|nr:hypothetical protein [Spirochaetales bacterium]